MNAPTPAPLTARADSRFPPPRRAFAFHARVRPVVESLKIDWYGWHGFRRGIASNLYELGADEKIVQRVLRHAKSHVTKDRYIKAFDPAVVAAMKNLEATVDLVNQSAPRVHQI